MTTVRVGAGSAYYRHGPSGQMVHVSGARAHSRHVDGQGLPKRRARLKTVARRRVRKTARRAGRSVVKWAKAHRASRLRGGKR